MLRPARPMEKRGTETYDLDPAAACISMGSYGSGGLLVAPAF